MIVATSPTFGLYLNLGAHLGATPEAVFDLTRRQAEQAEVLGYHDLWVTEHHAIGFGINPSALTTAAFLLGRTARIRVGTAVVLSPLLHPVDLAERAALIDQWSGGRFDLGLGRGGYRRDYELLGVDLGRWDNEPETAIGALLGLWAGDGELRPPPATRPHPPILLATSSEGGIACAATHGLALQHYFATPVEARRAVEARYAELRGDTDGPPPSHLHCAIVLVTGDGADVTAMKERLGSALAESFVEGDRPTVPQASERHVGPDGKPLDRKTLAHLVAQGSIVGPAGAVVDELGAFIEATGARRLALYQEAIADADLTMRSIERFASDVAPQLA